MLRPLDCRLISVGKFLVDRTGDCLTCIFCKRALDPCTHSEIFELFESHNDSPCTEAPVRPLMNADRVPCCR